MEGKMILLDSYSLANRAFFALPPLTNADGQPTNAVYGVTMMLMRLIDEEKPDYIIAAFDAEKPTFRHETYAAYKAGRRPMADELRSQIPLVRNLFETLQIPVLEVPGFEADDLLGTLSKEASGDGFDVYIVTGDRDAFQLVSPKVKVMYTKKGISDVEKVGPETLWERYQLRPDQMIELKGLMGDASDNIPGVPGFGEKTALRLIQRYGDIPTLLENIDNLERPKERKLLQEYRDQALQSRDLATIRRDVPLPRPWEAGAWTGGDRRVWADFFAKMGFRALIKRLQLEPNIAEEPKKIPFKLPDYKEISPEQFAETVETLGRGSIAFQLNFDEKNPHRLALALGNRAGGYFYVRLPNGEIPSNIRRWMEDAEAPKDCFDAKALLHRAAKLNVKLCGIHHDLRLAGHLVGAAGGDYTLTKLTAMFLGWEEREVPASPKQNALPFGEDEDQTEALRDDLIAYVYSIAELVAPLEEKLQQLAMDVLYRDIEIPLASTLFRMEMAGITIDPEHLSLLGREFRAEMAEHESKIYSLAGETFNIGSPKQLGYILFEKLGLPSGKKTKSGYSTDAEVLEALAEKFPIATEILSYRGLAKLNSTYVEALLNQANPETWKVHTTFQQTVTATGRLSSTDPNLQNIPVRTPEGRRIREAFRPSPGMLLLSADYSQIELRIMAHFSQDPKFMAAFIENDDIHARTAAEIFGVPLAHVDQELRSRAKAVNFGIIYGISGFGLAKGTGVSRKEAESYITAYFQRYEGVQRFLDDTIAKAREDGFVTTLMGRRRNLPDLRSSNFPRRSFAERTARNTPIQGTAADVIKVAMLRVEEALRQQQLPARILLQVHDELVLESEPDALQEVGRVVRESMEGAVQLSVPLTVEVKSGKNWGTMEPWGREE
jgi:DNA polymerase-1